VGKGSDCRRGIPLFAINERKESMKGAGDIGQDAWFRMCRRKVQDGREFRPLKGGKRKKARWKPFLLRRGDDKRHHELWKKRRKQGQREKNGKIRPT